MIIDRSKFWLLLGPELLEACEAMVSFCHLNPPGVDPEVWGDATAKVTNAVKLATELSFKRDKEVTR